MEIQHRYGVSCSRTYQVRFLALSLTTLASGYLDTSEQSILLYNDR